MLLIGSRSLATYVNLDRVPDDWDICLRVHEFEPLKARYPYRQLAPNHCHMFVGDQILELHIIRPGDTSTSGMLLAIAEQDNYPTIETPIGHAHNACLHMHKLLKLSSYGILNKSKNYRDLAHLKNVDVKWPDILEKRIEETIARQAKKQFFDRYAVRRFVDHDQLHLWVTESLGRSKPSFEEVIAGAVEVTPELFFKASEDQRLFSMTEEAIVLTIERWFLPNVKRENTFSLWEKLSCANTSTDPCIRWLDKLCHPGSVKDHPDWLAEWGQLNYVALKEVLQTSLLAIKTSMPKDFWHLVDGIKKNKIQPMEQ